MPFTLPTAPVPIRMADELDHYELFLGEDVARKIEPLIDRLRNRWITRRQHAMLVALLTENALARGQTEETRAALIVIEAHWRRCWLRYLPWPTKPTRPPIALKFRHF